MPAAPKFVRQEQHDTLAAEVKSNTGDIGRLSVRVEVISHDTTRLLRQVADLREDVDERFEAVESALSATRDEILRVIDEKHTVLLSAIMQLGKTSP